MASTCLHPQRTWSPAWLQDPPGHGTCHDSLQTEHTEDPLWIRSSLGDPFCLSRSPEYGAAPIVWGVDGEGSDPGEAPAPTPGPLGMISVRHGCPSSLQGAGAGSPRPQPLRGPSPNLRGGRPACRPVLGRGWDSCLQSGKIRAWGAPAHHPAMAQPVVQSEVGFHPELLSSPRSTVLLGQEMHAGS